MTPKEFLDNFGVMADAPGGIKKLRELVLELAVQGKLTERRASDEPVPSLLRRIQSEREEAVRNNPGLRLVSVPPVEADGRFEIPAEWAWVPWGSLVLFTESGWSPQAEARPRELPEWGVLKVSAVSWAVFKPEENKALPSTTKAPDRAVVRQGDFLMSRANTSELVGRSVLVDGKPERLILSDKIVRCEFAPSVDRRYLNYFNRTSTCRQHYIANASGTSDSMKNISREVILTVPMPLPPLAEQKRIVARVDQLMALLDDLEAKQTKRHHTVVRANRACLDALTTADRPEDVLAAWKRVAGHWRVLFDRPEAVGELRKAVLELAVRGALSPRAANGSAIDDLNRCRKNRAVAALPFEQALFAIPHSWTWTHLADLVATITDGDHQPPPKAPSGVPFLTIGNVTTGTLDFSETRYVPRDYFDALDERRVPREGDILYTVVGATYGRPVPVPDGREFCVQRHIAIIRPDGSCDTHYLLTFLRSPVGYRQATASITGTAQPTVPLGPLRRFKVPVPPLAEQKRIVTKVDQLMAMCETLEAALKNRDDRAGRLVRAVVGEAVGA